MILSFSVFGNIVFPSGTTVRTLVSVRCKFRGIFFVSLGSVGTVFFARTCVSVRTFGRTSSGTAASLFRMIGIGSPAVRAAGRGHFFAVVRLRGTCGCDGARMNGFSFFGAFRMPGKFRKFGEKRPGFAWKAAVGILGRFRRHFAAGRLAAAGFCRSRSRTGNQNR